MCLNKNAISLKDGLGRYWEIPRSICYTKQEKQDRGLDIHMRASMLVGTELSDLTGTGNLF